MGQAQPTLMNYLQRERETMEQYLPGLDVELSKIPLMDMEAPGNPAIELFRKHGGARLLVPSQYGGPGASALDMARIQRGLGARSPSLALATNMHTCTVAAIPRSEASAFLFGMIARDNIYLASGIAEGKSGESIFKPSLRVERVEGGVVVSGRKAPCSLSESMDFLTASVLVPGANGGKQELAIVVIPASSSGITRKPFGGLTVFGGAQNNEVMLNSVQVPEELVSYFGREDDIATEIARGFLWFELFVSASYLGVASALVERVLTQSRGAVVDRTALVIETEGAMSALEGLAHRIMNQEVGDAATAQALFVRYAVQNVVARVSEYAAELLGGIAYLTSRENATLLASARALAFHPPSRSIMCAPLAEYAAGAALTIP